MALTNCKECGGKVSDSALTCPHCGVGAPAGTARLVIHRADKGSKSVRVDVYINGQMAGSLWPGESLSREVTPARYEVAIDVPAKVHPPCQAFVELAPGAAANGEVYFESFGTLVRLKI